jgi:hypothetical protein
MFGRLEPPGPPPLALLPVLIRLPRLALLVLQHLLALRSQLQVPFLQRPGSYRIIQRRFKKDNDVIGKTE